MRVQDVMTKDVVTVRPETSLKETAAILAERHISGLPVVDEAGQILGVVSERDILFKERGPLEREGMLAWLFDPYGIDGERKLEARTAAEAMTTPAKTSPPWRSVSAAAAQMLEENVNRLPVVGSEGRLIGIVTRADLVRAFVRPDHEIEQEIREDVLQRTLWLGFPETLTLAVDDGKVTLSGSVERHTDAELVSAIVAKVPGVVEVESSVSWREEDGRRR
jgi:CBS domain-containing protein